MESAPGLFDTLETLIAPGRRSRLSPFVESAQFRVLFGQVPDPRRRQESSREILAHNANRIQRIASRWNSFAADGKPFAERDYADRDFLDAYLAYYFSVNVPKVQLVLLDLLHQDALPSELHILDLGVGTGTTVVAVLDFLLALGTVCDLFGRPFPIRNVELVGTDRSASARRYASKVVDAYRSALEERLESRSVSAGAIGSSDCVPLTRIVGWAQSVRWVEHDVHHGLPDLNPAPTLVIASNVLNELLPYGQEALASALGALPEGTICAILEPGTHKDACYLMRWRRQSLFVDGRFVSLGPCGQGLGGKLSDACDSCWNARREGFHQTTLYTTVRSAINGPMQGSDWRYDPFENRLLSWSYILARRAEEVNASALQAVPLVNGDVTTLTTRYIGTYRQRGRTGLAEPYTASPDDSSAVSGTAWRDYLKGCPVDADTLRLAFERTPGFEVPRLRHGDKITLVDVRVTSRGNGISLLSEPDGTRIDRVADHPDEPGVSRLYGGDFLPAYDEQTRRGIDEVAYRLFGFTSMRGFQHEILSRVLQGQSMLGIAATGGGKSECFILPSLLLPGITIVVSPLKALMTDQYEQRIRDRYGLEHLVTYINGDVPMADRQARLTRLTLGHYKLIYVTPEQMEQTWVLDLLARAHERVGIRYLALDEAHCISQWGHDFRPSYLNMTRRLRARGIEPVRIALTATASPRARDDICDELDLRHDDDVYVDSSNRPELNLVVRVRPTTGEKSDEIVDELRQLLWRDAQESDGAAIVFMPHTGGDDGGDSSSSPGNALPRAGRQSARVTDFASYLERQLEQPVAIYHGRMDYDRSESAVPDASETDTARVADDAGARTRAQQERPLGDMFGRTRRDQQSAFITGARAIMVATKGFGMGVDKPNIRLVIHRTPTENLEAYAQEAGRAGRDGEPATVILYFSPDQPEPDRGQRVPSDHEIQRFFLDGRYIRREDVVAVRALLQSARRRLRVPNSDGTGTRELLYLTSDEAIEYLDRLSQDVSTGFRWPALHRDLGEELTNAPPGKRLSLRITKLTYEQKRRYVHRILSVLKRIRPTSDDIGKRVAAIESFSEVGARVDRFHTMNWAEIRNSNMSFGHRLRDKRISELEFSRALQAPALFPLAERISLPMRDLVTMLNDMKYAEGRRVSGRDGPYWRSDLLSFSRIVPPEPSFDRSTRGTPSTVQEVPVQWLTDVGRRGWEIEPGSAFRDERLFPPYLEAFMRLHDARRADDEDAYAMLLTDYIGVTADGQLRDGEPEGRCLRGVLLGYLKTYEVVVGGNCLSCSRCVRNERFDASMEQRRSVVQRLGRRVETLLDALEQMTAETPSAPRMDELVTVIAEEQRAGRGLADYVVGWTNRLLSDTPEHCGANWTRLQLIASGLVAFDAEQFGRRLQALAEVQPSRDDPLRLLRFVDQAPDSALEQSALRIAEATLCRRVGDIDREVEALTAARKLTGERDHRRLSTVLDRLRTLWAPHGIVPDAAEYMDATLELASIADSPKESLDLYRSVMMPWDASRLREHVTDLRDRDRLDLVPVVVRAWLNILAGPRDGRRLQDAASILEQVAASTLERLADDDLALIWPFLSEQHRPGLAIRAARQFLVRSGADAQDTFDAIDALSLAASMSEPVPSDLRQLTAGRILRCLPALAQNTQIVDVLMERAVGIDVLGRAASLLPSQDVTTLTGWQNVIGSERLVHLGNTAIVGTMRAIADRVGRLSTVRESATRIQFLDISTDVRQCCEESGIAREEARDLWRSVLLRCGGSLPGLVESCLTLQPERTVLAHEAFDAMLACTPPSDIRRFLYRLEAIPASQVPPRFALVGAFLDLLDDICRPPGTIAKLDARTLYQRLVSAYGAHARRTTAARRPHLADMVHAVVVSQMVASPELHARWLGLEIDALCQGYRFDEAATIAGRFPHIRIGKNQTSATQHVENAACATPHGRRTQQDAFEQDYLTILRRRV